MNFLRRKLEALGAAVAFAEQGMWAESEGILHEERAGRRERAREAQPVRQRTRAAAYKA